MSERCLIPRDCQKEFAVYMTNQYGKDYGDRYLAVVTNPKPTTTSKKPSKKKSIPQAVEAQ